MNKKAIEAINIYGFNIENTQDLKERMSGDTLEGKSIRISIEFDDKDVIQNMWFYENDPFEVWER